MRKKVQLKWLERIRVVKLSTLQRKNHQTVQLQFNEGEEEKSAQMSRYL